VAVVLVGLAALAAVTAATLFAAPSDENEEAALRILRMMQRVQERFAESLIVDRDRNGEGEFGSFGELIGGAGRVSAGSESARRRVSGELAEVFSALDDHGRGRRDGYFFRVFLPDMHGRGVADDPGGGPDINVDSELSERWWCAYAWPVDRSFGNSAFFVSHRGQILKTGMMSRVYDGRAQPSWDAAFNGLLGDMSDDPAVGSPSVDGNLWVQVR